MCVYTEAQFPCTNNPAIFLFCRSRLYAVSHTELGYRTTAARHDEHTMNSYVCDAENLFVHRVYYICAVWCGEHDCDHLELEYVRSHKSCISVWQCVRRRGLGTHIIHIFVSVCIRNVRVVFVRVFSLLVGCPIRDRIRASTHKATCRNEYRSFYLLAVRSCPLSMRQRRSAVEDMVREQKHATYLMDVLFAGKSQTDRISILSYTRAKNTADIQHARGYTHETQQRKTTCVRSRGERRQRVWGECVQSIMLGSHARCTYIN